MSIELLSLGADLLGGIMGRSSQARQQRLQMQQAQKQFDMQMNESVQRRVKDARRAGVHPLFALGASVGASPTISAQGEQRGDPMQGALTSMASTLGVIEQNRASAKRDEAEAALLDSERKRIEQDLGSRGRDGINTPKDSDMPPAPTGISLRSAEEGGDAQGRIPARIRSVDEAGNEFDLPNPDLGLDEVGQIEYVLGVPDRMVKHMRKNAETKKEIRELEMELEYLRDAREHGGVDATTRARKATARKLRELRSKYRSLRAKAQSAWNKWSNR